VQYDFLKHFSVRLELFIPPRTGNYVICTLALNRKENNKNYDKESTLWSSQRSVFLLQAEWSQRPLDCWDRGFESHRGHGCLSLVSVVCCQVEVSATSWSLVQRSPTDCGESLCVIEKPEEWEGHDPHWVAAPQTKIQECERKRLLDFLSQHKIIYILNFVFFWLCIFVYFR